MSFRAFKIIERGIIEWIMTTIIWYNCEARQRPIIFHSLEITRKCRVWSDLLINHQLDPFMTVLYNLIKVNYISPKLRSTKWIFESGNVCRFFRLLLISDWSRFVLCVRIRKKSRNADLLDAFHLSISIWVLWDFFPSFLHCSPLRCMFFLESMRLLSLNSKVEFKYSYSFLCRLHSIQCFTKAKWR